MRHTDSIPTGPLLAGPFPARSIAAGSIAAGSIPARSAPVASNPTGPAATESPPRAARRILPRLAAWVAAAGLLFGSGAAAAQIPLPVTVAATGNHAEATVRLPFLPGWPGPVVGELLLDFEDASGLSPAALGVSAKTVSLYDPNLIARLPDTDLTTLPGSLPMLVTVQPPLSGGLKFKGSGRVEIHTHWLPYAAGTRLRLFKAPLGGAFYDVTDEIAAGSVRARGTYGGFSQFLILADARPTPLVIASKLQRLRDRVDLLPAAEQPGFDALLDDVETALALATPDYAAALAAADAVRTRAQTRAGTYIDNEWRATRTHRNDAGELAAGAATLRFSVAYLRDYGP
ncbi:DUF6689 family protein [Lysobacter enzymogenes]|uniref:DUF6689 family protein n=1 Tax=Lysobacter enzymogenes TaxID=69 RepID=UPI000C7B45A3|nr:DUF6689 family protein [Lysobacter enzymogenes]UZW62345.1 hypothetical protein BV903_008680 [Lysobacter enzymogenes]